LVIALSEGVSCNGNLFTVTLSVIILAVHSRLS
jgi:hypothetical protein